MAIDQKRNALSELISLNRILNFDTRELLQFLRLRDTPENNFRAADFRDKPGSIPLTPYMIHRINMAYEIYQAVASDYDDDAAAAYWYNNTRLIAFGNRTARDILISGDDEDLTNLYENLDAVAYPGKKPLNVAVSFGKPSP